MELEKLFSILKGNEYKINRRRSARTSGSSSRQEEETPTTKAVAFRAEQTRSRPARPTRSADNGPKEMSREELQQHIAAMSKKLSDMDTRFGKYKKFYKNNRNRDPTKPQNTGCFECGQEGHFKMDCPDLSKKDREALRAKANAKNKAMLAEEGTADTDIFTDTEDEDEPTSPSSSVRQEKCLMAISTEQDSDEVTSTPNPLIITNNLQESDAGNETSPSWEDFQEMSDELRQRTVEFERLRNVLEKMESSLTEKDERIKDLEEKIKSQTVEMDAVCIIETDEEEIRCNKSQRRLGKGATGEAN